MLSLEQEKQRFAPKVAVKLSPPGNERFTAQELAKYNGITNPKMYVAIKGVVFDVTRNTDSYGPQAGYHVFVGKDCSRALAKSSLDPADCVPEWEDLPDKAKKVLDDWFQFFKLRYNVIGSVV